MATVLLPEEEEGAGREGGLTHLARTRFAYNARTRSWNTRLRRGGWRDAIVPLFYVTQKGAWVS